MRNKNGHASPLRWMLRRYFFLFVICLVVTFAVFPMQGMMRVLSTQRVIDSMNAPMEVSAINHYTRQLSLDFVYSPLSLEMLCLLFGGLGFAAAIVLFRHLFSRKQGMMIAGLPMTRNQGFWLRCAVYAIWCLAPMAICMGIYPLLVRSRGLWDFFQPGLYLQKAGATMLINLYGFSLGAVCAAIFGTIWSAAMGAAMLAGSVEITLIVWSRMAGWYLSTLYEEHFMRQVMSASPVYALYKGFYQPGKFSILPGILAIALFLIGAWIAYRRAKPENAEHTLIQKKVEPVLVAWMTVLGGTAGAYVLSLYLSREATLYLGLILGAGVVWLLVRMILEQRIQISFRKWQIPAAVTAVMLLCCLGLRMDLLGFERYAPEAAALRSVRIQRHYDTNREMRFEEPESVEAALTWIAQAREETLAIRAKEVFQPNVYGEFVAVFEDARGRQTYRQYPIPEDRAELIDAMDVMVRSYSKQQSEELKNLPIANLYSRLNNYGMSYATMLEKFGIDDSRTTLPRVDAEKLREALREDLQNRTLASLQEPSLMTIYFEGRNPETGEMEYAASSNNLTTADRHTLELILGDSAEKWIDYAKGGFAASEDVLVFLCEREETEDRWVLKDYRMAESETEVREWMSKVSRCENEYFTLPLDRSREVRVYSLANLREQVGYGNLELDLEDPETLRHLPEEEDGWYAAYTFIAE